jgi:hypothetical protein
MGDRLPEDVMLDEMLRTPPEPCIPANFRQRLLTGLPETPVPRNRRRWFWPALGVFGLLSFIFLAETAFQLGVERWLTQPSMLLTILSIEFVFSILLLWRARA